MTKMEDRIKIMMTEMQETHKKYIDDRISGIFLFGFVMGLVFSYTGIIGFVCGVATGIVLARKFPQKALRTTENTTSVFYNAFNQAKHFMNTLGAEKN